MHASRRGGALAPVTFLALVLLAACDGTDRPLDGTASSTDGSSDTSTAPGCECFSDGISTGIPWNTCASTLPYCGSYEQDEAECQDDDTGVFEPSPELAESNAATVQCILETAAAGDAFQFELLEDPSNPFACRTSYVAQPDGTLQIVFVQSKDLSHEYTTSVRSGFDLSSCAGLAGADGWACIQDAVDATTLAGVCQEGEDIEY